MAIFSAAPLASKIFPSTAPRQRIKANPPNVLPTPFSIDFTNSCAGIPNNKPAVMATINNDKKGFIFL
jgi:hypothetical protein